MKHSFCARSQGTVETRPLLGGSHKLQSRCDPALWCHLRLNWGRICFPTHSFINRIQFPAAVTPRASPSCYQSKAALSNWTCLQFLATWASQHRHPTRWRLVSSKPAGDLEERDSSEMGATVFKSCNRVATCNNVYSIHSITFAIFYQLEASPRPCPHSGGGNYTKP